MSFCTTAFKIPASSSIAEPFLIFRRAKLVRNSPTKRSQEYLTEWVTSNTQHIFIPHFVQRAATDSCLILNWGFITWNNLDANTQTRWALETPLSCRSAALCHERGSSPNPAAAVLISKNSCCGVGWSEMKWKWKRFQGMLAVLQSEESRKFTPSLALKGFLLCLII